MKKNTKRQILDVSLDMFSRYGFPGTSVRQIAGKVGIRESAIYNHFKSKNEILGAIFEDYKPSKINADIMSDDLIEKLSDPLNFMKIFSVRLLNYWNRTDRRKFFRLLMIEQFREKAAGGYRMTDYLNETRSILRLIFDELIKYKFIVPADPAILADLFISPIYFILIEFMADTAGPNVESLKETAFGHIDLFWNSVKRKK